MIKLNDWIADGENSRYATQADVDAYNQSLQSDPIFEPETIFDLQIGDWIADGDNSRYATESDVNAYSRPAPIDYSVEEVADDNELLEQLLLEFEPVSSPIVEPEITSGLKVGDWIADGDNSRYATQFDVNSYSEPAPIEVVNDTDFMNQLMLESEPVFSPTVEPETTSGLQVGDWIADGDNSRYATEPDVNEYQPVPTYATEPDVNEYQPVPSDPIVEQEITSGVRVGDWIADGDNSRYATQADVNDSQPAPSDPAVEQETTSGLKVGDWIADGDNSRYATQADVDAHSVSSGAAVEPKSSTSRSYKPDWSIKVDAPVAQMSLPDSFNFQMQSTPRPYLERSMSGQAMGGMLFDPNQNYTSALISGLRQGSNAPLFMNPGFTNFTTK